MDEGEQALAELASRIERMDARAKNLAHTLSRLVAVNRIYVSNFDQYSETIRLGLAWGFIDAAAQLAELHVNQIAPALPVIFGTLRLDDGLVGDVLDFDGQLAL
ncbi:MAG TPA: hypothetical protein VFP29_10820 [Methyloceanibacter sp.]|nr:hypothetical protein [Methyloceanibacter sp.]